VKTPAVARAWWTCMCRARHKAMAVIRAARRSEVLRCCHPGGAGKWAGDVVPRCPGGGDWGGMPFGWWAGSAWMASGRIPGLLPVRRPTLSHCPPPGRVRDAPRFLVLCLSGCIAEEWAEVITRYIDCRAGQAEGLRRGRGPAQAARRLHAHCNPRERVARGFRLICPMQ
jgi:hypothetical protein